MALLAIEGFDHYLNDVQTSTRAGYLQWSHYPGLGSLVPGRIDGVGKAFHVSSAGVSEFRTSLASNLSTGYIGMAAKVLYSGADPSEFRINFHETNSNKQQFFVALKPDGSIETSYGRTGNNFFPHMVWMFVEVGWVVSKTGGSVNIRINGVLLVSHTGVNTAPLTSNLWVNGLNWVGGDYDIDDFYICDSTVGPGSYPCNGFLGDRRVFTLVPTGNGYVNAWTPTGAASNWQAAATADDDTSFNGSATPGAEDMFVLSELPGSVAAVIGVQVTGSYKKSDATSHTLVQRLRSGASEVSGSSFLSPYALNTSYTYYSDIFPVDPATSASWAVVALAPGSIQIGYRLES